MFLPRTDIPLEYCFRLCTRCLSQGSVETATRTAAPGIFHSSSPSLLTTSATFMIRHPSLTTAFTRASNNSGVQPNFDGPMLLSRRIEHLRAANFCR